MARVSQEHLDARRRQILEGAIRCFARNGFHATSMQDVLRESGLSAGAVYRYFTGKDELITAIALHVFDRLEEAFTEAARLRPSPLPDEMAGYLAGSVFAGGDPALPPELAVQAWAETLRDERLAQVLRGGFERLLGLWTEVVEDYQRRGLMPGDVPAGHVARTVLGTMQGFVIQRALFPGADPAVLADGLRGLTSMTRPDEPVREEGPEG
ncbi:TetR/AcrR family transcriptional regulator [Streptomyces sodiiphilus]|uniref:TetR/AcrR family transcriptional regulator n=1 Tax=Streptomyces sodiiphilus TaxID=226217 RepID=A0ABP5AHK4_9ACTN